MKTFSLLLLGAVWASGVAQAEQFPWHYEDCLRASGLYSNPSAAPVLAWAETVRATNSPWVRLEFGTVALGARSWLAVVSTSTQQTQRLDSVSLQQWRYLSGALRGTEVRVELWVGADDEGVFASFTRLMAGEEVSGGRIETLCGADSRTRTRDDRVGRLFGGGCTAWLTPNGACCTAGHCGYGTINGFFEVNVPSSSSSGTPTPSAPEDQFPMDDSNIRQFFDSTISDAANRGQEYTVCGLFPNSNTGEYAHERGFLRVTQYVPVANTSTLRITGYGLDDSPVGTGGGRNSNNETEQTSTGPYRGQTDDGTRVYHSYTTDTEAANSGSPMMYLIGGYYFSLGIHTLGGCSADGTGANSGTSFNKSTLATALNTWQGSSARYMDFVSYPGVITRTGSIFRPANNLAEGYSFTPTGGTLYVVPGSYPKTTAGNATTLGVGTTKVVTLRSLYGTATIGN
jgi:hypothetical protein